ncbi:MAG: hypothetical protein K5770_05960, partial [Lachnospiraceae bacterium]|nr:hypothetical protein [Lachnospiraceae bacterium]
PLVQDKQYHISVTADGAASVNTDGISATAVFASGQYTGNVTITNSLGSLTINKTVSDSADENAGGTFEFTVTREFNGTTYYYSADGTAATTEQKIQVTAGTPVTISNLPFGTYTVTETDTKVKDYIVAGTGTVEIKTGETDKTVNVTNTKIYGTVTLTKYDGKEGASVLKGLKGVKFALFTGDTPITVTGSAGSYQYDTSSELAIMETDADGKIVVSGLPLGNYYFKETMALDTYILDESAKGFELSKDKLNSEGTYAVESVAVYNSDFAGGLKFRKIDADAETETGLGGVRFKLYKKDGNTYTEYGSYEIESNATPGNELGWVYLYGLPKGDYYLQEIPDENGLSVQGYLASNEELHFTITETDGCESTETDKYVTLSAPSGDDSVITFAEDGIARVGNHNVKGSLHIEKTRSSIYAGTEPLPDVVFTLEKDGAAFRVSKTEGADKGSYVFNGSGDNIEELVTDENGKIDVTGLPWGTYTLKETAPEGYKAVSDKTFTIGIGTGKELSHTYQIDNEPVTGDVLLEKFDRQRENYKINGAEFDLYRGKISDLTPELKTALMNGEPINDARFTKVNSSTLVVTNDKIDSTTDEKLGALEYGEYFFVETEAPAGFEREEDPFYQVIIDGIKDGNNNTVDCYVKVENDEGKGQITLFKTDADNGNAAITGAALDGATFELYYKKRDEVKAWYERLGDLVGSIFGSDGYSSIKEIKFVANGDTVSLAAADADVVLNTNEEGEVISVTVNNLEWGDYYFVETKAPKGYVTPTDANGRDLRTAYFQIGLKDDGSYISNEGFEITRTISNKEDVGNIEFVKVDAENDSNKLAGAQFELYYSRTGEDEDFKEYGNRNYESKDDNRIFKVFSDDETGKVSVPNLPWGHYYFTETKAPDGFMKPADDERVKFLLNGEETDEFVINADNADASATIDLGLVKNDKIYGDLELYKVDGTAHTEEDGTVVTASPLEGATFYLVEVIYDQSRNRVSDEYVEVTGENGVYKFSKSNGSKTVMAASASGGEKYDNKSNKLTVENLPAGTYRIYEEAAPEGYRVNTNQYCEFTVRDYGNETPEPGTTLKSGTANHYVIEREFVNTDVQANVRFIKVSENTDRLGGVTFHLYKYKYAEDDDPDAVLDTDLDQSRRVVKTLVTDITSSTQNNKIGEVEAEGLGEGMYYFLEDAASAEALGYIANTTKYTFTVTRNDAGKYVSINGAAVAADKFGGVQFINNTKKTGNVTLHKIGEGNDSTGLAGVTFKLYRDGQENPIYEVTTDNTGIVEKDGLTWGSYHFVETAAPAKYILPDPTDQNNWIRFTIPEENSSSTSVDLDVVLGDEQGYVRNYLLKGEAGLVKKDGNDKLNGAEFELYKIDPATGNGIQIDPATGNEVADPEAGNYKLTTDGNGEAKTEKQLGFGEYYFLETAAPVGYELPESEAARKHFFTIDREHTTVSQVAVTFRDHKLTEGEAVPSDGSNVVTNERKKGRYQLYKYEYQTVNGNRVKVGIPGVTFTLEKESGIIFTSYKAESGGVKSTVNDPENPQNNGYVEFSELEWGNYRIVETVPDGYALPEGKEVVDEDARKVVAATFTIDATHLYTEEAELSRAQAEIQNDRASGKIRLVKVDRDDTGQKLGGAVFDLYRYVDGVNDVKIGTYTVGSDGELDITDDGLIWGEQYYFTEITPPDDYVGLDEHTKTSTWLRTKRTDSEEVTEKANLAGRTDLITLDAASANGNTVQIVQIENRRPTKQDVELSKKNDDGEMLTGAIFKLYRVERNAQGQITKQDLVYTSLNSDGVYTYAGLTSGEGFTDQLSTGVNEGDQYGKLLVQDLPEGKYIFEETKAPALYKVKTTDTSFEVLYYAEGDKNGTAETVTALNSKIFAGVRFTKYSVVDGNEAPLDGVRFKFYRYVEDGEDEYLGDRYSGSEEGTGNTAEAGAVSYSGLGVGRYVIKEVSTPNGAYKTGGPYYFHIDAGDDGKVVGLDKDNSFERIESTDTASYGNGTVAFGKVLNPPSNEGSVSLVKYESIDGVQKTTPINGAVFELFRVKTGTETEDVSCGTYTTGKNTIGGVETEGSILVNKLAWGRYYFTEKSVPRDKDGKDLYVIPADPNTEIFEIGSQAMVKSVTVYNDRKYGSVSVHKTGKSSTQSEAPLEGAEFKIYKDSVSDANCVATLTTDADGNAAYGNQTNEKKLEWGRTYIIKETSAPTGYVDEGWQHEFTVSAERLSFGYNVVNTLIQGKVNLRKKDRMTGVVIPNVEFELYSYTLNEDNTRNATKLSGYTYKTDSEGWLCQIKGENSTRDIGPLDYGKYYFKEKSAPDAYILSDELIDFEIKASPGNKPGEDGLLAQTITLEALNDHKLGTVKLHKAGDDKNALNGARFRLYRTDGAETLGEMWQTMIAGRYDVTDGYYETGDYYIDKADGTREFVGSGYLVISDLRTGDYELEEIEAPKGYTLGERTTYQFSVTESSVNAVVELPEVMNPHLKGSVRLTKVDKDSGEALDGAEFKLYKVTAGGTEDVTDDYKAAAAEYYDDALKAFVVKDGKIEILNALEWGTYYFEETKGMDGYVFAEGSIRSEKFTVSANDMAVNNNVREMTVHTLEVKNEKIKGYVSLEKSFVPLDEKLNSLTDYSGIQFKISRILDANTKEDLKDEEGNVRLFTTDTEGKISAEEIGKLEYGTYVFEEVSLEGTAAEEAGYALNTVPSEPFTIDSVNTVETAYKVSFVNSAIAGSVHFDKKDEEGTMIPEIGFKLYLLSDEDKEEALPYKTAVSTENGVDFTGIPKGEYFFTEDAASAEALGFEADTTHYYFTISEQGEEATVYTKNAAGELVELEEQTIINKEIKEG